MVMAGYGQMLIPPISQQLEASSHLIGENLKLVDIDDVPMAQPRRVRWPPSRFADYVSH